MDRRAEQEQQRLRVRHLTSAGTAVQAAVTLAATTKAVTFLRTEPNALYGVVATPSWGTTVWVTNRTTTGFTLHFGTGAPANALVDWLTFRSED
jgi:hypothetical protein